MKHQKHRELLTVLSHPAAFLPIVMSVLACITLAVHVLEYGVAREADEGPAAHLWQILMVGQIPLIIFFAFQWIRRSPLAALGILGIQALVGALSCASVLFLGL